MTVESTSGLIGTFSNVKGEHGKNVSNWTLSSYFLLIYFRLISLETTATTGIFI
jgi:hypothetical protein